MEVHQHTHNPGKKWTHYLWEFLMLFLAIFSGFLAENWREHIAEHQREKQFIRSYIEDLKQDTASINTIILLRNNKIIQLDSLLYSLNNGDPDQNSRMIYYWARGLTRSNRFLSSDRTIKQLKNSGGLRLIRNQAASDSIMAYDEAIERFYYSQDRQTSEMLTVSPLIGKLLNANVLESMISGQTIRPPDGNPPLRSKDKDLILDISYDVHQLKTSDVYLIISLEGLKRHAVNTISYLKSKYNFE